MKAKDDMLSMLRISKLEKRVKILLAGRKGNSEEADLFVSEFSSLHSGPESIEELLNRGPLFIPARFSDGNIHLLNRAQILYVEEQEGEPQSGNEVLRVYFVDGTHVDAMMFEAMPERYKRTLDFFNGKRVFLPLLKDGTKIYINKELVTRIREISS